MRETNLAETLQNYEQTLKTLGLSLRKNWNKEYLFARRMVGNATKISFISKSKLEGLKANVKGFVLDDLCAIQRQKYFNAVKPSQFIQSIVDTEIPYCNATLQVITKAFNKQFLEGINTQFKVYEGEAIAEAYHSGTSIVGCMGGGKPQEWFKVYANTKDLKLVALTDEEGCIIIRALLWYSNGKYFLDNTYEQGAIQGDTELRKVYQYRLYLAVLKHLNKRKLDTAFLGHINEYINNLQKTANSSPNEAIKPILEGNFDYEYFPYADTFKSIHKVEGTYHLGNYEGDTDYYFLDSQHGRDANDLTQCCYGCGCHYDEDEITFSDYHDEWLCNDCCNYCEDRGAYVMSDDTTYDNYRGVYLVSDDLDN